MKSKNNIKLIVSSLAMVAGLNACGNGDSISSAQTAPETVTAFTGRYVTNGNYDITKYESVQTNFDKAGRIVRGVAPKDSTTTNSFQLSNGSLADTPVWDSNTIYDVAGTEVKFTKDGKTGIFTNQWWTQNNEPDFVPDYGKPWALVKVIDGSGAEVADYQDWDAAGQYGSGTIVQKDSKYYKAKWWNQDDTPGKNVSADWETPWSDLGSNTPDQAAETEAKEQVAIDKADKVENLPEQTPDASTGIPAETTIPDNTPAVPPVTPVKPSVVPTPEVLPDAESTLPASGYAFLRDVTNENWDWLFPLRNGKENTQGGTYNGAPYIGVGKDIFTLAKFEEAVLKYNNYAQAKGYKQFLNDGSKRQQGEEFAAFMSNVSRETSGSWKGAPAPWIEKDSDNNDIWKGGLYWTEEVGHSTDADGKSSYVAYVDAGSSWTPEVGRSYHGRGPIQLSWNYNYGAFSAWLYDNGIYTKYITKRNELLEHPQLVNKNSVVSMLSAIWFWMTPQGPKPSSHDVMYGYVSNKSTKTQERGLPPQKGGTALAIPAASGDSTDPEVVAYRLGTTINIINGGIECNGAAAWHPGPPQRASYYNAYAKYFSDQQSIAITQIPDAVNIWDTKVSDTSKAQIRYATCYSQKSYYGY